MARFEIAEALTGRNEGGYANSKKDNGGETYAGIARKFWGNWIGWWIIDDIKVKFVPKGADTDLPKWRAVINQHAKANLALTTYVNQFYKSNFWDANSLDEVLDQDIANSVYDFGVNAGIMVAAKMLQDAADVQQDGQIGSKTLSAVNNIHPIYLLGAYNAYRKRYYESIAKGNQAGWLSVWLKRVKDVFK